MKIALCMKRRVIMGIVPYTGNTYSTHTQREDYCREVSACSCMHSQSKKVIYGKVHIHTYGAICSCRSTCRRNIIGSMHIMYHRYCTVVNYA